MSKALCSTWKGHPLHLHKGTTWDTDNLVLPQQLHQETESIQPPLFLNFLYCGMSWKISEGSTGPCSCLSLEKKQEKSLTRSSFHRGQFSGPGGLVDPLLQQQPLLADHFVLTLPFHQALHERVAR